MNLSFAGCGFLGIYHVGVAVCLKKYAPHLLIGKISGASFGALSACCLLCDLPIGELTTDVLRVVGEARAGSLGPFSPSFSIQNVLLEGMDRYLPKDAHKIVSGKLHISLTRVYDGKNVIVSEFPTREDLLQALLASCFVPVFSGMLPPRFHGVRYMDGGFSDNLPVLDENTITVSPFCGESDICPRDLSSQLFHVNVANTSIELSRQNMSRFARILFPPKPEVLSNMCKQGFDDALRFLHRNNMITCTRCLAVQTTYQLQDVLDDSKFEYDPDCEECKTHRQDALVDDLPDTVMTIFENAIHSANNGLVNWVMRQRGMRYISLLALPYRVPADVMYATFTKFVACTPKMSKSLWRLSWQVLSQLHAFLYSAHDRSDPSVFYKLGIEDSFDRRRSTPKLAYTESRQSFDTPGDTDAFEHILNVTTHNEALLAYYYLDSENKMKMTEIYDVTDADTDAVQSPTERDVNKQLEFDNDWTADLMPDNDELDIDGLEEELDRNIFSDPESEWESKSNDHSFDADQPESDRQILEQIDCERLAKTVTKRAVILTNFMLNNLIEALSELLRNSTLLESLLLEGLPLKIPYLNPLCDAILANSSLQHLFLPRCLIGDAGCMALCKMVRCLPNILTLDLSECDLTPLGAGYIAELIRYQKLHRYSENWIHTLRYRLPELDTMAGLRRLTLCGNTQLGDTGVAKLFDELADDLWIKALDVQNCGITEAGGAAAIHMMKSNTTLVVLDLRYNQISTECHAKLRQAVRHNEQGHANQYQWLGNMSSGSSDGRCVSRQVSKTKIERASSKVRNVPKHNTKPSGVKKERDYSEVLEEKLQEETSHRKQLEELNIQLVEQMKRQKQHQIQLWANAATSSGSEQSFQASSHSEATSSSSNSVTIDQQTLEYIQRTFRDIYAFIKNNQCHGQCLDAKLERKQEAVDSERDVALDKILMSPKRAQSQVEVAGKLKTRKSTKSAHLLGRLNPLKEELRPEMLERNIGDVKDSCEIKEIEQNDSKKDSHKEGLVFSLGNLSDSSDTLVCSPAPNPRLALFSSSDED
ncbi:uncharacterized protein LOC121728960 [Aricia agestis]|uniref:uncharacterized protein LOC121728960 n=1 Tax=Aricia agestis TaxID=91739 RepID=UPI001C20B2FF|nr:uncharacterized protein LOC121728960 [Aricia agestis]